MANTKKKQDSIVRLKVGDIECEIDMDNLTLGELEEAENYFDRSINEIDFGSIRGTVFLAYLARRRADARWTLEATRALRPDEVEEIKTTRPTKADRKTSGSQS